VQTRDRSNSSEAVMDWQQ